MIHTILVPLDGSPLAERALTPARRLARQTHATIVVMRAALYEPWMRQEDLPTEKSDFAAAHLYLEAMAQQLAREGFAVRRKVVCLEPAEAIGYMAAIQDIDLIVMSTHGRTGLPHLLLGSVAEQVLRDAPVPVLLVQAHAQPSEEQEAPFRSILVSLDGGELAEAALNYVGKQEWCSGAQFLLLRTLPLHMPPYVVGVPTYISEQLIEQTEQAQELQRIEARRYLEALGEDTLGARSWSTQVVVGEPGSAIVDTARAEGIDLIVMSTHARGGIQRLLHGSVAEHVVRHAQVPVLLLRSVCKSAVTAGVSSVAVPA